MDTYNCALLIDDDGVANFSNYRIIKKMKITSQIETVIDGEKALDFIQYYSEKNANNSPELILLDLNMPVIDGYQFLESYYKKNLTNRERVKVIVLTTSADPKDMSQVQKFYNLNYIVKPLTQEKLEGLLQK